MGHAVFVGAAPVNPFSALRGKLVKSVPQKIALSPEQFIAMVEMIRAWRGLNPNRRGGARPNVAFLEDYMVLALALSARPAEMLALSLDDVIIEDGIYKLHLRAKLEKPKDPNDETKRLPLQRVLRLKHDDQRRIIRVADFAVPTLQRLITDYVSQEQRLLFSTKKGTPYAVGYVEKLLKAFREQHEEQLSEIGIENIDQLVPYSMRKTAATVSATLRARRSPRP